MKKYIVHAYEQSYGGLHGIETWFAIEGELLDVENRAAEESKELMLSYSFIEDDLLEKANFYSGYDSEDILDEVQKEEWNFFLEDAIEENVAYSIWEVDIDNYDIAQINKMLAEDAESFVSEFCTIVIGC